MTKSELIARLATRYSQLVAKDAEFTVKMILDAMTQSLVKGQRIEIRGFGSFGLNTGPAGCGRRHRRGAAVLFWSPWLDEAHHPTFMKLITQLSWLLRVLLFLAVFAFALMNTGPVTLRFFLGQTWETPMILVLLLAFAFGAAIGVLACLSRMLGQRREINKLERELNAAGSRSLPPQT